MVANKLVYEADEDMWGFIRLSPRRRAAAAATPHHAEPPGVKSGNNGALHTQRAILHFTRPMAR